MAATPANAVIWLHGDHLSADNPAMRAFPGAPVVFVFDEDFLRTLQFGFGRLAFIYESVMDVFAARAEGSCSVRRGVVLEEVIAFARDRGATRIITTQTVGDRFAGYVAELENAGFTVRALDVPELVAYPNAARAPKRFSAWWREVEGEALAP
ncbi:MAG: deoxyribodipyrimidine photo-lyase [Armatimonadetes bacterium]|nr:deoxyribodipyrimidine photo-lyase [Armatimonadota bacterium]